MDEAEVEILLRVREMGREAFERVKAQLMEVGAIDEATKLGQAARAARVEAAEARVAHARIAVINATRDMQMAEDSLAPLRRAGVDMAQAERAVRLDEHRLRVAAATHTLNAAELALADAQRVWNDATAAGDPVTTGWLSKLKTLAGNVIPDNIVQIGLMVAGIVTLVGVLTPFLAVAAAATVIVTAFGVAAAGAVAFLGALGAGFAAIGAGVLALGISNMGGLGAADNLDKATSALQKAQQASASFNASHQGRNLTAAQQLEQQKLLDNLATAQSNYNGALAASQSPISKFIQDLKDMRDRLGALAAPIAAQIIQFADNFLPTIEKVASSLITWFGQQLPSVLNGMSQVIQDVTPDLKNFAKFLGDIWDEAAKFNLQPLIEALIRFSLGAVEGLVRNLLRLTEWFQDRLPTYGPIVAQVFGAIGSAVQDVASLWARFADWLASNWPAIVAAAKKEINDIRAAWEEWYPKLQPVIEQTLPQLITALKTIGEHAGGLVPIVLAVVTVILILVTTVATLESWLATLLDWLGKVEQRLRDLTNVNWAIDVGIVIPGLSQLERVYWLLTNMPGATGVFGHGGSGGGEGGGGGGASIAWITP